ncbi:hypothetical protein NQ315_016759, partial [Exocentrus adspersus]
TPETSAVEIQRWDRGYFMMNGILYRYSPDYEGAQQVVPKCMIEKVLHEHYTTLQKIILRYYWTGMRNVAHLMWLNQPETLRITDPIIAIDLFGPLPETPTGEKWIFIVEDTSTRWTEMFALREATAEACARCLINEIVLRFGTARPGK